MDFVITWRELLIAIVLATLVYLLETALFSRRRGGSGENAGKDLREELRDLRREVAILKHRLDSQGTMAGDDGGGAERSDLLSAYDHAADYARQGLKAEDIADRCGISRDEAALIAAMHKRGQETVH